MTVNKLYILFIINITYVDDLSITILVAMAVTIKHHILWCHVKIRVKFRNAIDSNPRVTVIRKYA